MVMWNATPRCDETSIDSAAAPLPRVWRSATWSLPPRVSLGTAASRPHVRTRAHTRTHTTRTRAHARAFGRSAHLCGHTRTHARTRAHVRAFGRSAELCGSAHARARARARVRAFVWRTSATTAATSDSERELMMTVAPSESISSTVARPIPFVEPVTRQSAPSRRRERRREGGK